MTLKTIFTTEQVARICKVAPRTVNKWFDSGRLRGYRIPGSQDRRIPREHLVRFLKEHGMPLGELEEQAEQETPEPMPQAQQLLTMAAKWLEYAAGFNDLLMFPTRETMTECLDKELPQPVYYAVRDLIDMALQRDRQLRLAEAVAAEDKQVTVSPELA